MGGPDWFDSDRFDIVAKAPDDAPPEQMLLMMRTLLADRFKLAVHTETREIPVYALVMARSDGKPGPQLRPATVDCAAMLAAARQPGAPPPPSPPAGDRPLCGMRTGPGRMMACGYALADVARNLSSFAGRIVLDKTGLTGTFDLDLTWTPDQIPQGPLPPGAPPHRSERAIHLYRACRSSLGSSSIHRRDRWKSSSSISAERPTAD